MRIFRISCIPLHRSFNLCANVQTKNVLNKHFNNFNIMIVSEEPEVKLTGKYSIKETSSVLGIHRHTLRAYVKAGYIRPTYSKKTMFNCAPRQRFLGAEILRFWKTFV